MKPNRSSIEIRRCIAWVLISVAVTCSGCRLTYIFHAASGQFRLIHESVPVQEALADDSLSTEEKERLRLVTEVKSYGEKLLGLTPTENYQTVYLGSEQRPVYVISASPKDSLTRKTWWFPVVGRVPYLAFFDKDGALAEKEKLIQEDLDVTMGMAEAYSTLGWFKDPVTLNLIQGSTVDMVETILHEMTHTTLYVAGQGEFNEGLAQLVGRVGALRFLETTYGVSHPFASEALAGMEDERLFCGFLNEFLKALRDLYDEDITYEKKLSRREQVFSRYRHGFDLLKGKFATDHFTAFGAQEINNAYLMAIALYHEHFLLFEAVLREHQGDVGKMLAFFQVLARQKGDMLAATTDWLARRSRDSTQREACTGSEGLGHPIPLAVGMTAWHHP